jgi:hypothetical protein
VCVGKTACDLSEVNEYQVHWSIKFVRKVVFEYLMLMAGQCLIRCVGFVNGRIEIPH